MRTFMRYLELFLTAVGLVVVLVVFFLFRALAPWRAAAIAAVFIGVFHGILFFFVRTAQRRARTAALIQARHQLDDLIRNKLQVVLCAAEMCEEDWRPIVHAAVLEIETTLCQIEQEPLAGYSD